MSLFTLFKKNKQGHSLVFSIGSGSLSGAVVKFTEAPGETITAYFSENIPFQKNISVPNHLKLMLSSLATLASKLQKNNTNKIDRIFYLFSSPWSTSQTKTVKITEPRPIRVTNNYINRVVDEQEKLFKAEVGNSGKIIEKKIIQVKINGYVANNFEVVNAKDIEISIFFTIVPEYILESIEQAVAKTFNIREVWCHSASLSLLSAITNLFPLKKDFLCISTSEEITDIVVVKGGIISDSATIPFGRNDFLREISETLMITKEVTDSQFKMHSANHNNELASVRFAVAMNKAGQNWLTKTMVILNDLKKKVFMPNDLFLVDNNDLSFIIGNELRKQDFEVLLLDNKKIKSQIFIEDAIFRVELMFLDNLYKI